MKQNKSKMKGVDAFDEFFARLYGSRWPSLLQALSKEPARSALVNPYAQLSYDQVASLGETAGGRCASPFQAENGIMSHYALDQASVLAATSLPLKDSDRVLDMCAAPGGKALTLIFRSNESVDFVLNERSATRRARLKKVIDEYLSEDRKKHIKITGHDATRWGLHEQAAFDAILLDAPCSSERHLLEQPKLLEQWSPHRTRTLAMQQYAMLAAASAAVKPGGYILYATCSISTLENDDVISKLLKKRDQYEVVKLKFELGEETTHGWIFLPDVCSLGPLFVCLIQRRG